MASTREAADRHLAAFNQKDLEGFIANEAPDIVSFATCMGPLRHLCCHIDGTTRLPVMGPPRRP
jgi:hypothetical protein